MWKRPLLLGSLFLLLALPSPARDKQDNWLEVRSQHFTVLTNSNEKTGRRIADQFERMRSVFHMAFPNVPIDSVGPILVIAVKDDADFRALEPQVYLAKGQVKLAGLFLRTPDKNYVLMRIDAQGDHPYSTIYHEYTHLLLGRGGDWIPLWFNEGLAEFYQNTDIHEKDVAVGQGSFENFELLRQNRLLPLPTLFTVDANSPYYHEENKTSIFYAESWALVHYLQVSDLQQRTQHLIDYLQFVAQNLDSVTAATRALGDLKQLQANLENYVRLGDFKYFKLPATITIDDASFQVRPLAPAQADATRADFLAYNQRTDDARALLDRILKDDPNNVLARETMGYLAFRAGHHDEARNWYEQAVKLDSQSYLAHYYYAAMSMELASPDDAQIENSLRTAIKLNPSFAPAYDRLAVFEGMRRKNLDEARQMSLTACQIDPGNVSYRVNAANVLVQMERPKDAVTVLRNALKIARTPEEAAMLQNDIMHTEEYATAREQEKEHNARVEAEWNAARANASASAQADPGALTSDEQPPKGAHHIVLGKLQNVQCHTPRVEMILTTNGKTIALHNSNYFKIEFSAFGFTPKGDLNPCEDLEGTTAKVDYVESSVKPPSAFVFAIEIHK
jgi:Tfp pilus assembly protein PilF